jgi:enoyl-[acyl-carrier-protein] reductase (NADH)
VGAGHCAGDIRSRNTDLTDRRLAAGGDGVFAFLASDQSRCITGQVIAIDDGATLQV